MIKSPDTFALEKMETQQSGADLERGRGKMSKKYLS